MRIRDVSVSAKGVLASVVMRLDGLGGEVVEVLVGAFGVEPGDPLGGAERDVVDVAPGPWRRINSF